MFINYYQLFVKIDLQLRTQIVHKPLMKFQLNKNSKTIRKNIKYDHDWLFSPEDFEKWKQRFNETRMNWQK